MIDETKYNIVNFPVGNTGSGFISQAVSLRVCNLCGAVVGNIPAHDIFCFVDDLPKTGD